MEVICLRGAENKSGSRNALKDIFDKYARVISRIVALPAAECKAGAPLEAGPVFDDLIRFITDARADSLKLLRPDKAKACKSAEARGGEKDAADANPIQQAFNDLHNSESFWFPFLRFLFFLTNLCCMKDVPLPVAAMSQKCTSAVFQVLCSMLFDLPADLDLNASLLSAPDCPGYLPCNVGTKKDSKIVCLQCRRPSIDHALQHTGKEVQDLSAMPEEYLKLVCRVGSIGWASHDFMKLVHGTGHLGKSFSSHHVEETRQLYRQHIQQHVFSSEATNAPACSECLAMSVPDHQLPPAVAADISSLQQLRRAELVALVSHMDALFNGASPKLPATNAPLSPAAPAAPPPAPAPAPAPAHSPPALLAPSSSPGTSATPSPVCAAASSNDSVLRSLGTAFAVSILSSAATLPAPVPTSPALASGAPLDPLASQLLSINVSNNVDVLAQLSVKLQACGVTSLSDFEGMGIDEVRASVADANLNPLQFKRLFDAVSKPKP